MRYGVWTIVVVTANLLLMVTTCPDGPICVHIQERKLISCQNVSEIPNNYTTDIEVLEICNLRQNIIDLSYIFLVFPRIKNLSISEGSVNSLILKKSVNNDLEILELKNLSLSGIYIHPVLQKLKHLDVRGNRFRNFDFNSSSYNISKIYLHGNTFDCSLNLEWALALNPEIFQDVDKLTCYGSPYNGKPLLKVAKHIKSIKKQCPEKCSCTMPNIVTDLKTENLQAIIAVNCSAQDLTELPKRLPINTKILLLNENAIQDLSPLKNNPYYRTVQDLYLDDNQIKSIEGLEGSYWFNHFRVLSLSGNQVSQVPTYALDNALQINPNMPNAVRIYLGGNPWRCDCVYTPGFQEMLQKYKPQIQDVDDVKCSYIEGDDNSFLPILSLSRSSMCRPSTEYSVRALDLLNVVLASLIIMILGKLAYDYYHFKRTGKLPWIVMKMP